MHTIKSIVRNMLPERVLNSYHYIRALYAAYRHGFPAKKLIIIGVTGTKGKTSTSNYIWSVLTRGGYTTGLITSANFRIGTVESINTHKMTMPSPEIIQATLAEMVAKNVEIAVVEMTSEGMKQYRHIGIPVDIAVFTNLTPEHLKSHGGSFDTYKEAKGSLFASLSKKKKQLRGKDVSPEIIANSDSEHAAYYLNFPAEIKHTFGLSSGDTHALDIESKNYGTTFNVSGVSYHLGIPGIFNVYNALPAIVIGEMFGVNKEAIQSGLSSLTVIPGRMERITLGQSFTVFIDYAHEPAGMKAILETAVNLRHAGSKIILLTGVIGGGRESRVPLIHIATKYADTIILTNEDPYEEDPEALLSELEHAAIEDGKVKNSDLFVILDRAEAIQKAFSLAHPNDIVLITGKGAEETMMVKGGPVPWNERAIVREILKNYSK